MTPEEAIQIIGGLDTVASEWTKGIFEIKQGDEDIHTANERRLTELVGPVGGKLHTGRYAPAIPSASQSQSQATLDHLSSASLAAKARKQNHLPQWSRAPMHHTRQIKCSNHHWTSKAMLAYRSRNDQVVTDYRLWLLAEVKRIRKLLQELITVACDRAEAESDALMPGFTHLQPAQTVRWGHWIMCHCAAWQRDDQRLRDAVPRISQLPLGSGALAGNPFLVDRQFLSQVLPSRGLRAREVGLSL